MGNACASDTSDLKNENDENGTARLLTKPDKLPALSQAVKNQCKRANNERMLEEENKEFENKNGVL